MRAQNWIKTTLAAVALGSLAACAAPALRADVSRFQAMPAPTGQSFAIVASDPANRGGLEFGHYAALVAAEMTRLGYRAAAPGENADMQISLGYGVDQGRERVVRSPGFGAYDPFWGPGWGRFGLYSRPVIIRTPNGYRYAYGLYDPWLWGSGFGDYDDVRSYTVYKSGLNLVITRNASGERLFEGTAEAASRSNDLTVLVPNLVSAMFTGFPGNNGETVRITVAPPERRR